MGLDCPPTTPGRRRTSCGTRSPLEELGVGLDTIRESTRCSVASLEWPRPRPKKVQLPNTTLSAAERMRQLMAVGGGASKEAVEGTLVAGEPRAAAERPVSLLSERGLG